VTFNVFQQVCLNQLSIRIRYDKRDNFNRLNLGVNANWRELKMAVKRYADGMALHTLKTPVIGVRAAGVSSPIWTSRSEVMVFHAHTHSMVDRVRHACEGLIRKTTAASLPSETGDRNVPRLSSLPVLR
jgi:hypothetical protein